MKLFQKSIIILFICIMSFILISCRYKGYKGKYPELYTVAINSLLWNNGHSYGADFAIDSDIVITEEDLYGRIMFAYQEKYYAGGEFAYTSLVICQKTDNNYVYYYSDYNFINIEKEIYEIKIQEFSAEKIQELKLINDWNKEIDLNKCIKIEVTNKKKDLQIDKIEFMKIFENENLNNITVHYLTSDNYNRAIYYGYCRVNNNCEFLVMIFDSNGLCDLEKGILKPSDLYDYQDELKEFKEQNNWDFPIS